MTELLKLFAAAVLGGLFCIFVTRVHTAQELRSFYRMDQMADPVAQSSITAQFRITQQLAAPHGGPQALEGDTIIAHDHGTVFLALGTMGNVEMNGHGDVTEIRSMQSGGVVTNDGHVSHWTGMYFSQPRAGSSFDGDIHYTGPVNIDRYDYVTFDNGWSIRPQGDRLLICRPDGSCREF